MKPPVPAALRPAAHLRALAVLRASAAWLRRCAPAVATAVATLCAVPAAAQIDLSGNWATVVQQDFRGRLNPSPADFLGVPLTADARAAALSYSEESLDELGRQCHPRTVLSLWRNPFGLRIWPTTDPAGGEVVAWHLRSALPGGGSFFAPMTIWVDSRRAPSAQALHTDSGFTTGHWEGDTLVSSTTHIIDALLTVNGAPSSNQATMTSFISRYDELLVISAVVRDPVYLAAPYVIAQSYQLSARGSSDTLPYYCVPEEVIAGVSDGAHTIAYPLQGNPLRDYMRQQYHIPADAALGGPQTMYPEFRRQLRGEYTPPSQYCIRNCCGAVNEFGGVGLAEMRAYDRRVLECTDSMELVLN